MRYHSPLFIRPPVRRQRYARVVSPMAKKNMTWLQAKRAYPRLDPFRDSDKDGVINMFDCRPFNKKRHDDTKIGGYTARKLRAERDKQFYLEHGGKRKAIKFAKTARHSSAPEDMKGIRYERGDD